MQAACEAVMQSPSEGNVVRMLELWSPEWKHRGRQRAIGSGSYEQYCTLGLFAYGGNDPCLSKASTNRAACVALNHFLRSRFPDGTWTSIAVVLNPRIGLHRDILNMIGKPNHAIALGSFTGGRIWVEDDDGTSSELRVTKRNTQQLWGSWIDMHDKPVSFNARRFHKVGLTKAECGLLPPTHPKRSSAALWKIAMQRQGWAFRLEDWLNRIPGKDTPGENRGREERPSPAFQSFCIRLSSL